MYSLYKVFRDESLANINAVKTHAKQCGAVGVKFLQFLMMNEGFISGSNKKHFDDIFDQCEAHPWSHTVEVYERDIGRSIYDDFTIDGSPLPIGSGSIGQVYRLSRRCDAADIALKVRHPNVEREVERFVRNLRLALKIAERITTLPFAVLIKEFLSNINSQTDFIIEAANTRMMRSKFQNEPSVIVPYVYKATHNLIIMSYHQRQSYISIKCPFIRRKVSFHVYLLMISSFVIHDFMHCDMHFGNFSYIHNDDGTCQVVVYDCGVIGSTGNKEINKKLVKAAFDGNFLDMIRCISHPPLEVQKRGRELEQYFYDVSLKLDLVDSEVLGDFIKRALTFGIKVDPTLLRLVQGLMSCSHIVGASVNHYSRVMGSSTIIPMYIHGVAKELGIHAELVKEMETWFLDDPNMMESFLQWLDEAHGHRDRGVFVKSMMRAIRGK